MDTQVYYVTTINGYRSGWMPQDAALAHAKRLVEQMERAGWRGQVHVYYRDGSIVATYATYGKP